VTKGRLKRPVSLPNIGRIASLEAATLRGTQVGVGQQVQLLMRFQLYLILRRRSTFPRIRKER
jgi:hypothetical protein